MDVYTFALAVLVVVSIYTLVWRSLLVIRDIGAAKYDAIARKSIGATLASAKSSKNGVKASSSLERVLLGIAQGAGVDVDRLVAGDAGELQKVETLLGRLKQPQLAAGGYL